MNEWKCLIIAVGPDGKVQASTELTDTDVGAIGAALNSVRQGNDCYAKAHDKLMDIIGIAIDN